MAWSHLGGRGGGGGAFIKTFIFLDLLILLKLRRWSDDFLCQFDFLLATGQTRTVSRHQPHDQGLFSEIRKWAWHFIEFSHPHLTHWYEVLEQCWWVSRLSLRLASMRKEECPSGRLWDCGYICLCYSLVHWVRGTRPLLPVPDSGLVWPCGCAKFYLISFNKTPEENLRHLKQPTHLHPPKQRSQRLETLQFYDDHLCWHHSDYPEST